MLKGTSKAKALIYAATDTDTRKQREQKGLDTLVVFAVNDEYLFLDDFRNLANAKNIPPEEYIGNNETQRN